MLEQEEVEVVVDDGEMRMNLREEMDDEYFPTDPPVFLGRIFLFILQTR